MADRWIRVPRSGSGTMADPHRPKYADRLDGWSGQVLGNSPRYLVRAYGDGATLDALEAERDVQALQDGEVENALNALSVVGDPRDIGGWGRGFAVE